MGSVVKARHHSHGALVERDAARIREGIQTREAFPDLSQSCKAKIYALRKVCRVTFAEVRYHLYGTLARQVRGTISVHH